MYLHPPVFFSILTLLTAAAGDLILGDPPTSFHPVGIQGRYISILWNKRCFSGTAGLFFYGLLLTLSGLFLSWVAAAALQSGIVYILQAVPSLLFRVVAVFLSAMLLKGSFSFRNLLQAGNRVADALAREDIEKARYEVSYHLVSRRVDELDSPALASAALESLSENFTDSTAAPFFYYALGGPAAAWAYRFTNTADAMLGYRDGDREWGGKAAARLDDFLNWIPARFAGWIMVAAAFPGRLDVSGALRVMRKDARICSSPNSGWTMAAAAGALGVRLEKENVYIINAEGRQPRGDDIRRLNRLLRWSLLLCLPLVLLLNVLILKLIQII